MISIGNRGVFRYCKKGGRAGAVIQSRSCCGRKRKKSGAGSWAGGYIFPGQLPGHCGSFRSVLRRDPVVGRGGSGRDADGWGRTVLETIAVQRSCGPDHGLTRADPRSRGENRLGAGPEPCGPAAPEARIVSVHETGDAAGRAADAQGCRSASRPVAFSARITGQ